MLIGLCAGRGGWQVAGTSLQMTSIPDPAGRDRPLPQRSEGSNEEKSRGCEDPRNWLPSLQSNQAFVRPHVPCTLEEPHSADGGIRALPFQLEVSRLMMVKIEP